MKVKVRFIEGRMGHLSVLEVTTSVRHPLSDGVDGLLAALEVRIVHRELQRGSQWVVQRFIVTEKTGRSISLERRGLIQARVLEAVASMPPPVPELNAKDSRTDEITIA